MDEGKGNGKRVCVTGASGYIASWLVKLLLQRGYTVNAAVRDLNDPRKTEHLMALEGAKESLNLFKADLMEEGLCYPDSSFYLKCPCRILDTRTWVRYLDTSFWAKILVIFQKLAESDTWTLIRVRHGYKSPGNIEEGSFDAAVAECEAVFHTCSPVVFNPKDPQVELLDPAVKGTLNVLNSCAKVPSLKRVVLTSSTAAVAYNGEPRTPQVVVDGTWFTNPNLCRESKAWYVLSKTLAEEAAWKFVKEKGIDMVTINPAVVIGPLLPPTLNTSATAIAKLFGSETYENMTFGWVHVKDVVMAHILASEIPSAEGSYCLVESVAHYADIVRILKELYPNAPLPEKCADDKPLVPLYQVSKDRTRSLGIEYIPLKTSLEETVESLKEKGFISI